VGQGISLNSARISALISRQICVEDGRDEANKWPACFGYSDDVILDLNQALLGELSERVDLFAEPISHVFIRTAFGDCEVDSHVAHQSLYDVPATPIIGSRGPK
jgi:hypothetical protein